MVVEISVITKVSPNVESVIHFLKSPLKHGLWQDVKIVAIGLNNQSIKNFRQLEL